MWNLMSLDGFMEGEGGDVSWHETVWCGELEALSIRQGGRRRADVRTDHL